MSHQIQEKSNHFLGKCNVKCLKIKLQASIFWCAAGVTYVQVTLRKNCQSKNPTLKGKKTHPAVRLSPVLGTAYYMWLKQKGF